MTSIPGPDRPWHDEPARYRQDIICPATGEPIPLYPMSIRRFSDTIYFVHCPDCNVRHQFITG